MDLSELNRLEQRNEISDILRRAKALIDTRDKWFGGEPTISKLPQNCAGTAIMRVANDGNFIPPCDHPAAKFFAHVTCGENNGNAIAAWNNRHTHAEVMQAFDRAIALAEQS